MDSKYIHEWPWTGCLLKNQRTDKLRVYDSVPMICVNLNWHIKALSGFKPAPFFQLKWSSCLGSRANELEGSFFFSGPDKVLIGLLISLAINKSLFTQPPEKEKKTRNPLEAKQLESVLGKRWQLYCEVQIELTSKMTDSLSVQALIDPLNRLRRLRWWPGQKVNLSFTIKLPREIQVQLGLNCYNLAFVRDKNNMMAHVSLKLADKKVARKLEHPCSISSDDRWSHRVGQRTEWPSLALAFKVNNPNKVSSLNPPVTKDRTVSISVFDFAQRAGQRFFWKEVRFRHLKFCIVLTSSWIGEIKGSAMITLELMMMMRIMVMFLPLFCIKANRSSRKSFLFESSDSSYNWKKNKERDLYHKNSLNS